MTFQRLTLQLDGITAADYLAHVRDPDPPGLGIEPRSVAVQAEPLGDTIDVTIGWSAAAPDAARAAGLAGLPVTADVVAVTCRELTTALAA